MLNVVVGRIKEGFRSYYWGAWVAQSIKCPTVGFGSGHDLMVNEFKPCVGLHAEPAWDSLSLCLSLSASPLFMLTHCLSLSVSLSLNINN